MLTQRELSKTPCPKCGRRGLHFAMHPHAFGWKDYGRVECRFCSARFKVRDKDR